MIWASVSLFAVVGLALMVWRRPVAHWEGLVMGGRIPPGCAVIQGVLFLILAFVYYLLLGG